MMLVNWTTDAIADLKSLRSHIAKDKPGAAREVALHISRVAEVYLAENPELGDAGRVPGTRELVVSKTQYTIVYEVKNETVLILRLFRGSQQRPNRL